MDAQKEQTGMLRQWQLLFVYNCYRVFCIVAFIALFFFTSPTFDFSDFIFGLILLTYIFWAIFFFYLQRIKLPGFNVQVLWSGTLDIIYLIILISGVNDIRSGLVILLNVTVAVLSILVPGRLAIFFAAVASSILLGVGFVHYLYDDRQMLDYFYSSGMHGIGIFATALTAWYLANRVRSSELIAEHRGIELADMQRINEYIIERLHSGVIYLGADQQIQLINTATRHFFNLQPDTEIKSLAELSTALTQKYNQFLDKINYDLRPAQTIIDSPYLRVHFFAASDSPQTAVVIFLDDMSAIAQQAQQLKLASLGRFSASIAHELRNPLGAISHAVQLFGDNQALNEEDARLKQLIINNCNRMNNVIKNVLQLSRREKSQPQIIELMPFFEQFKHEFCSHNTCNIIIETPDEPISVLFDKSQLEQILVILCDNAIHHGKNERGEAIIIIRAKQDSRTAEISISDMGRGVPQNLEHDIFEPFFSTVRTGLGMGLFIAKDLCEINQANLTLTYAREKSCFVITLNQTSEMQL
ncbi:sensor histidine kinase [Legionella dresdenensis]|uniref:histidine kinase n=1 Tax=Legionella dresdenensis TaxID=450200 RepID=A0ABV8CEU4_9GAMM